MNREKLGIYTSRISFINGVSAYLDNTFYPRSNLFVLRTTPGVWQYCGIGNKDIVLSCGVIDKAVRKHHMKKDEIVSTIIEVFEPLFLFKTDKETSEFKGNGFVISSDIWLEDDTALGIVALHPNRFFNEKDLDIKERANIIASLHPRTISLNGVNRFYNYINKGLLVYVDDIKLEKIDKGKALELPLGLIPIHNTSSDFVLDNKHMLDMSNNNILKKSDFVKYSKIFDENNSIELLLKEYAERTKDYRCFNKQIIKKPSIVLVCYLNGGDIKNVEIWDKERLHYVKQNALCVEYKFNKELNRYFYKTSSSVLSIYKNTER